MPTPSKRNQKGLGEGLFDIQDDNLLFTAKSGPMTLRLADIEPRSDQPRKQFDQQPLEALAESIGTHGVLQPIIVRPNTNLAGTYEIIAGERRWRAAKMAGLSEIPVVILEGDELKAAQVSIIENIQREDLNPVEEALAYRTLMERFNLTQEQVAAQVGKSRSAVANMMRLLDLPNAVLELLSEGSLTTGHARALLGLEREEDMISLADQIVAREMTVREVEKAVKHINAALEEADDTPSIEETAETKLRRVHIKELENRLLSTLGRKVKITNSSKKRVIELAYNDDDDLEELLKSLCGEDFFSEQ
jgi:ParB family chromosome partitioning protein